MSEDLRLVAASAEALPELQAFLDELGAGEAGFGGSDYGRGLCSLDAYLRRCEAMSRGEGLTADQVPQTTFWLLDARDQIAGMSRLRHRLNDDLLHHGGHIGYYVRRSRRGERLGTALLHLTLTEARCMGIARALLSVNADNQPSIRVIEANGGVLEDERVLEETGAPFLRYWIDLAG